ncbi:hypothetical protein HYY70_02655 [Candidatus Woesearchaeota archaeon]|nr:hypothetical protein [Candidatus Woesearchaeota archaeon]
MTKLRKNRKSNSFVDILLISLLVILIGVLISSIFSTIEMFKMRDEQDNKNFMPSRMSRMSLTAFDKELAVEFMDQNHDGRCDVCGMPVEQCIDSGQLECNMDSNAKIGILGSQHIHADWKIYIDGKALDFSDKSHMERMRNNMPVSSFIHVDSGAPAPEKTGDVLHMHASGVPLWIFFKSVEMNFNKDCITLENKEKFCNDENRELKFFINGKESNEFENYVFNDLDKILISYGDESEEEVKNQLKSITDFAELH